MYDLQKEIAMDAPNLIQRTDPRIVWISKPEKDVEGDRIVATCLMPGDKVKLKQKASYFSRNGGNELKGDQTYLITKAFVNYSDKVPVEFRIDYVLEDDTGPVPGIFQSDLFEEDMDLIHAYGAFHIGADDTLWFYPCLPNEINDLTLDLAQNEFMVTTKFERHIRWNIGAEVISDLINAVGEFTFRKVGDEMSLHSCPWWAEISKPEAEMISRHHNDRHPAEDLATPAACRI